MCGEWERIGEKSTQILGGIVGWREIKEIPASDRIFQHSEMGKRTAVYLHPYILLMLLFVYLTGIV